MLGLLYSLQTFLLIALQNFDFFILLRGEWSVYYQASYGTANRVSSGFVRLYCLLLQELNAQFFLLNYISYYLQNIFSISKFQFASWKALIFAPLLKEFPLNFCIDTSSYELKPFLIQELNALALYFLNCTYNVSLARELFHILIALWYRLAF